MPLEEKILPSDTAILVIDPQVDFVAPHGKLAAQYGKKMEQITPLLPRLKEFVDRAVAKGLRTYFTKQVYDRTTLNDLQREQYDRDGKLVLCEKGTEGAEFYGITEPDPSLVFIKNNWNVFSNPELLKTLLSHNVKTLVLTGFEGQYCVEVAARNAFDLGFKIVLAEDLIGTNAKYLHEQETFFGIVRRTMGEVVTSRQLLELWEA